MFYNVIINIIIRIDKQITCFLFSNYAACLLFDFLGKAHPLSLATS